MINKSLKKALIAKLKITSQALSQRIQKLRKKSPMSSEEAAYVIAHEEGIDLYKYLEEKEIIGIRQLVLQNSKSISTSTNTKSSKNTIKNITINISGEFKGTDPLLNEKKLNEARAMAAIYPLLYVLENSIRQFICLVMEREAGPDWWENEVPTELKTDVKDKKQNEKVNSWHQRRGSHPIDYLDMKDLPRIISKITKKISPNIIPSHEWFKEFIKEVYISRCVLCHMNPLDKDSITSVKLKFNQWQKQIRTKINLIK